MKTSRILTLSLALCLIATTALAQDYATPRILYSTQTTIASRR